MNVLLSGSHGLLATVLLPRLKKGGHQVRRLVRSHNSALPADFIWNPMTGEVEGEIKGIDAVIHLAGESIASGRWTDAKKKQIRESRIRGTKFLSEQIANMAVRPKAMLCASAIGYYGDRGSEELTENSPPGKGFLADLCKDWEEATGPARDAGIRVVNMRIGIVLSRKGGALGKMLLPFQLGAGGNIGDGSQYMSCIAIDDLAEAIVFCMENENISGPVNLTGPEPVPNTRFTKALGSVLGRPTFMPMPAFAAKLALGEMADELLLASAKVLPKKLESAGFKFAHPDIEDALRYAIKN